MSSFGENLKREREMRGVTLEEMSESTKIGSRLLNALEQDRFSELPGGVFTRGFIRAYAQYLGLDDEHILAEYKRAAQPPATDSDLSRLAPGGSLASKSWAGAPLVPWVVIAVLLGAGYALYRYSHRPLEIPPAPSEAQATAAPGASASPSATLGSPGSNRAPTSGAATASGAQNPSVSASTADPAGSSGGGAPNPQANLDAEPTSTADSASPNTPPNVGKAGPAMSSAAVPVLGEGGLLLQVSTTEQTWVAVAADGKTLMQRLLPPNSVRTFRAKDSFDVTTGNAQDTVLTLNGEPQKPLGREGEFKKVHLTPSLLEHHAP